MKPKIFIFAVFISLLATSLTLAQSKRAQTSMKFLSVSQSARASAMSGAVTAVEMGAYAPYYNPSSMANIKNGWHLTAGSVQWITDINHNSLSLIYRPENDRVGVFGVNASSVDYGDIISTARADNEQGYEDLGLINPTAMTLGLSYANAVTDQFSIGANYRYIKQVLGNAAVDRDGNGGYLLQSYSATTYALDFGVFYKTGFESLNFAMTLRNFSPEVSYNEEEAEIPLTFKIGLAMDVFDLTELDADKHSLLVSIDANRPRDYDEQLLFGFEYTFIKRFKIRAGNGFPKDEEQFSLGFGIVQPIRGSSLAVDYSYTQFGVFGEVNRFSVQIGL